MDISLKLNNTNINIPFNGSFKPFEPKSNTMHGRFIKEEWATFEWFVQQRINKLAVSGVEVREHMLDLIQGQCVCHLDTKEREKRRAFAASSSWFAGFKKRFKLSIQRVTSTKTVGRKPSIPSSFSSTSSSSTSPTPFSCSACVAFFSQRQSKKPKNPKNIPSFPNECPTDPKIISFNEFISKRRQEHNYNMDEILNFDETRIYVDMPRSRTLHFVGCNDVQVETNGKETEGVSIGLTCAADGSKMTPLVIFRGSEKGKLAKNLPIQLKFLGVNVDAVFQKKAFMDESVMIDHYLESAFLKGDTPKRKLLVWDSMRAHFTEKVKDKCKAMELDMAVIPGGYTPILQPLDVGIIKSFKGYYRNKWAAFKRSSAIQKVGGMEEVFDGGGDLVREEDVVDVIGRDVESEGGQRKRKERKKCKDPDWRVRICRWISESWEDVKPQTVVNSFRKAGWCGDNK